MNLSCYAAEPDSDIVHFNKGAAAYKKGDYQGALDSFTQVLTTDDKQTEADALYNLGNCTYQIGKAKEGADVSTAAALMRESLDYYKRAVEMDQKNTDARFNHEFVERELKVLLDKLKQEEQRKQGTCSVGKEQKAGGKRQGEEQQKEEREEGQATSSPQEEKQRLDSAQRHTASRPEPAEGEKEEQAAAEDKGGGLQEVGTQKLSQEEAHVLLERYGREEATPEKMGKKIQRAYDDRVLKDW